MPGPWSKHCSRCDINWPDLIAYKVCFGCLQETQVTDGRPMDEGPAIDLKRHLQERHHRRAQFEAYYSQLATEELLRDLNQNWLAFDPAAWEK